MYESGYFKPEHITMVRQTYNQALEDLKPQALNLAECFEHSDNLLNSCIGNSYGDIYEQQLEWAKASSLN